jgi:hypothetical protein
MFKTFVSLLSGHASYLPCHRADLHLTSQKYLYQPLKDEAQTALFEDSPYRAVNILQRVYKNRSVYII